MENHLSPLLFLQSLEMSQVFIKAVGKGNSFLQLRGIALFCTLLVYPCERMQTGIFSVCVCQRREKCSSLRALPEHRQQLGTIAALIKKTRCWAQTLHNAENISVYPTDITNIKCHLHCRHSSSSSPASCIIPTHMGRALWDTHCRAVRNIWGFSNNSLCCSHLTPDNGEPLACCQCLDHSSCSLGSSPLNNSSFKFISLPKSQNTKWIQLRQRQSGFRSLTLTLHE